MKMKTCPNGHIYDEDLYPQGCPYCDPGRKVIDYDKTETHVPGAGSAQDKTHMAPIMPAQYPSGDDGKTVSPSREGSSQGATIRPNPNPIRQDGNRTMVYHRDHSDVTAPVAGWLVCVKGPQALKGKSFEVLDKINTIGRDWSNDIRLDDPTITAVDHARIAFDPKHREFALLPEKATNIVYLNDHAVYSPTPLSAYDSIEFGECQFVFVPFCGPRFGWDTGLEAEE